MNCSRFIVHVGIQGLPRGALTLGLGWYLGGASLMEETGRAVGWSGAV